MSNTNYFNIGLPGLIFILFFLWIGELVAGWIGLLVAVACAAMIHSALSHCTGTVILRLHGAQKLDELDDLELFWMTRRLAQRFNLLPPPLYFILDEAPNAFTVGCNAHHRAMVLTTGLQRVLDREELAGVIAHELAHLKNGDTRIMTWVALLAMTPYLAGQALRRRWTRDDDQTDTQTARDLDPGLVESWVRQVVMPIVTLLVRCRLTGSQEFEADALAAWATDEPLALSSALQKIDRDLQHTPMQNVTPATAHLFIINPYSSQRRMWISQTHPPTAERVALLEALGYPPHDPGFAA